ncbi:MAG TPA: hypothetical protein DCM86_02135 [Verrucomicrobiales bacterium]|nr:hypothetical protein [Verrucomicrobiales bacterium]
MMPSKTSQPERPIMSKSSKKRHCPAVGRTIPAGECGENRASRYPCPADCPFNPWSHGQYDQMLEIETSAGDEVLQRINRSPDFARAVMREVASLEQHGLESQVPEMIVSKVFVERDTQGRTFGERWAEEGFPGVRNDARVLLQAEVRPEAWLLEVRRIIDDRSMEGVNLLDPSPQQPHLIFDRTLAAAAPRFGLYLFLAYRLPHYLRPMGSAMTVPSWNDVDPFDALRQISVHHGGPADGEPLRSWLLGHLRLVQRSIEATWRVRYRAMVDASDPKHGRVEYTLGCSPADCIKRIGRAFSLLPAALTPEEQKEGFVAGVDCLEASDGAPGQGEESAILGKILVREGGSRVEAFGVDPTRRIRAEFERVMGEDARFVSQRLDDLSRRIRVPDMPSDPSLIPPGLAPGPSERGLHPTFFALPNPAGTDPGQTLSEMVRRFDREWMDSAVPALEGETPRKAALDPRLRPILVRLVKDRIRRADLRNLETGGEEDPSWTAQELGLHEIVFPPPPPRAPVEEEEEDDGALQDEIEEEEEDAFDGFLGLLEMMSPPDRTLPPAPGWPSAPLALEEVQDRLAGMARDFRDAEALLDTCGRSGCPLLGYAYDYLIPGMGSEALTMAAMGLAQVWLLFVPPGTRGPVIDPEAYQVRFMREVAFLVSPDGPPAEGLFLEHIRSGPQPGMVEALLNGTMNAAMASGEGWLERFGAAGVTAIAAHLMTSTALLQEALQTPD